MNEVAILKAMTPGGWGIWTLVALAVLSLIKGWPVLRKIGLEGDTSLRRDLMSRVSKLESDLHEERVSCERELGSLRAEIAGLHRQLIAFQLASGRPLPLDVPAADAAIERMLDRLRETE